MLLIKNEVLALTRAEATAFVRLDQYSAFDAIDHSTQVWGWFCGSRLVQVLPLRPLSVHQDWLHFVCCQKTVVWCASGLCPGTNPILIIFYSPQQSFAKSSWHQFSTFMLMA